MRDRAVRYVSTRGASPAIGFEDVLLAGPAPDGGLYVPELWPAIDATEWPSLKRLGYAALAARILGKFTGDALSSRDLSACAERAYSSFGTADPAPLVPLGGGEHLLELFHGPTFAFKDYALQLVGQLFEHMLARRGGRLTVLGATSGDTGSAAIAACAGRAGIEIFMLHPKGRISTVQRRQMTTVEAGNVHNIAVEGTFDDCQDLVKTAFADPELRTLRLCAVNSINWARIAAQIVYYGWAGLKLGAPERVIAFAVPTGNFGNVFAGHAARRMGLPIDQLIIGSNRNDILTRFFARGEMEIRPVEPSLSPSMDIQVSSNFERLLFELLDGDGAAVAVSIATFRETGRLPISSAALVRARALFAAARFSDTETLATIAAVYKESGVILDPHSAVGLAAGRARSSGRSAPLVALATAHPAKFPEAVRQAIGVPPPVPPTLAEAMRRPERCAVLPSQARALKDHLLALAAGRAAAES